MIDELAATELALPFNGAGFFTWADEDCSRE
jgi:hypothetical protein